MTLSKQNKSDGKIHTDTLLLKYRYADKVSLLIYIYNPCEAIEEQEQTVEVKTNYIKDHPFRGGICAPRTAVLLWVGEKGQSPIPFTSLVIR
jgi:hypothetical protein